MINDTFLSNCSLQNKIVLITGGATGLGFAMAHCAIAAGAQVIILGRREAQLQEACKTLGNDSHFYRFDITEWGAHDEFAKRCIKEFGHVDVLINNAGNQFKAKVEDVLLEDMSKTFDVHVKGSFAITRAFLPYMKQQGSGSVIFISSMSGFIGLNYQISYAVAKTAVMGLVRTLSSEVSYTGIRFNAIVPGWFETPMMLKAMGNDKPRQEKVLNRTPEGHFGKADDIGWAAVYLGSDASKFVTGTSLVVDGGALSGF